MYEYRERHVGESELRPPAAPNPERRNQSSKAESGFHPGEIGTRLESARGGYNDIDAFERIERTGAAGLRSAARRSCPIWMPGRYGR
jgi:hypothetical protein